MLEKKYTLLSELYKIVRGDPGITRDQNILSDSRSRIIFSKFGPSIKNFYCIFIHRLGYRSYIKFGFRENLGCQTLEKGLFNSTVIGTLRVNILNENLDWRVVLRHIPCTRDLKWEKNK